MLQRIVIFQPLISGFDKPPTMQETSEGHSLGGLGNHGCLTVYSGDVVLLELDGSDCVAEVVLHLQLPNGTVYSIITPWHRLGNNMFKAGDGSRFAETKKLVLP